MEAVYKMGGSIQGMTADKIEQALENERLKALSITGTKHIEAVLHRVGARSPITPERRLKIDRIIRRNKKEIRDRRTEAPSRESLTPQEMEQIIAEARTNDVAYLFAIQTFLALRAQSVLAIEPADVTIDESLCTYSVLLRKEKMASEEGAPRAINRLPFNVQQIALGSRRWQPLIDMWLRDMRMGGARWVTATKGGYDGYRLRLKALLADRFPRLREEKVNKGLATHCARRTGATLHIIEGWKIATVMVVGGWRDVAEFGKYIKKILSIADVQHAA